MLTSFGRKLKQINIILGFLTFFLGIAALVWFFLAKPPENETEIKGLEINNFSVEFQSDQAPSDPPFFYEIVVSLKNQNEKLDADLVYWEIKVQDENNKVIAKKEGTTEIKGNEQKEVKEEISIDKQGKNVSFEIVKIKWKEKEID